MVLKKFSFYKQVFIADPSLIIQKANDMCRTVIVLISENNPFLCFAHFFSSCKSTAHLKT
jgi:hypothetical protein